MVDLNVYVKETLELLNLERETEIDESRAIYENTECDRLEKKGVCLRKMVLYDRRTGLYGRTLLTLGNGKGQKKKTSPLSAHCFTVGDIAGLSYSSTENNVDELSSGVVTSVSETSIVIAFDESFDSQLIDEHRLMKVTRLVNDVTFKRMKRTIESLGQMPSAKFCSPHLVSVLFGNTSLGLPLNIQNLVKSSHLKHDQEYFNPGLNVSQQEAVQFALTCHDIGIIHGPPGTGKTTTIIEIIIQAVKKYDMKILACAPSNVAVDNILERLACFKIKAVRLGHPARLMDKLQAYSLDAILNQSDETSIVKDVRKDINTAVRKLHDARNSGDRSKLYSEIKILRKELRKREGKALKQVLQNAEVILSTNISACDDGPLKHLPKDHFDFVVIDEAAQALEAACWIPLQWAPRCILAGDHKQLPPTITSCKAAQRGLGVTLMERVIKMLGDKVVYMLTTQYRMNDKIMQWASQQLYDGKLQADSSVAQHVLSDLPWVSDTELVSLPLLMIDTAGCDLFELQTQDEESKGNEGEADVVLALVEELIDSNVKQQDIGVITPYNLQVELLRSRLSSRFPAIEIRSVDGFQGREKEVIVISMVRSNTKGNIGFLSERRRMNVAVTRARRQLMIVGDSSTISHDSFLNSLVKYISDHGETWSAEQYRNHIGETTYYQGNYDHTKSSNAEKLKKNKTSEALSTKSTKGTSTMRTKQNKSETSQKKVRSKDNSQENLNNVCEQDDIEKLEAQIKTFVIDPTMTHLVFPCHLSSKERYTVHSMAEELGLEHESKGVGNERFIAVSKKSMLKEEDEINMKKIETEFVCNTKVNESQLKDDMVICVHCGKEMMSSNIFLHEIRCEYNRPETPTDGATGISKGGRDQRFRSKNSVARKKKNSKSQEKQSCVKKSDLENHQDDFDELLAEFRQNDSQCAMSKCKKSVLTLGQKCRYCNNMYCIGHRLPEDHGCHQVVKEQTRSGFGMRKQISQKTAAKRTLLEKKLDVKIKDLEIGRKSKIKNGK